MTILLRFLEHLFEPGRDLARGRLLRKDIDPTNPAVCCAQVETAHCAGRAGGGSAHTEGSREVASEVVDVARRSADDLREVPGDRVGPVPALGGEVVGRQRTGPLVETHLRHGLVGSLDRNRHVLDGLAQRRSAAPVRGHYHLLAASTVELQDATASAWWASAASGTWRSTSLPLWPRSCPSPAPRTPRMPLPAPRRPPAPT